MSEGHYYTFVRTWWRTNPSWPGGREPHAGRMRVHARNLSYEEAQQMCKAWNATHNPGKLSRKMEFSS